MCLRKCKHRGLYKYRSKTIFPAPSKRICFHLPRNVDIYSSCIFALLDYFKLLTSIFLKSSLFPFLLSYIFTLFSLSLFNIFCGKCQKWGHEPISPPGFSCVVTVKAFLVTFLCLTWLQSVFRIRIRICKRFNYWNRIRMKNADLDPDPC
jgi:hypothetical protein